MYDKFIMITLITIMSMVSVKTMLTLVSNSLSCLLISKKIKSNKQKEKNYLTFVKANEVVKKPQPKCL